MKGPGDRLAMVVAGLGIALAGAWLWWALVQGQLPFWMATDGCVGSDVTTCGVPFAGFVAGGFVFGGAGVVWLAVGPPYESVGRP